MGMRTRWPVAAMSILLCMSVLGAPAVAGAESELVVAQEPATPWLPPLVETDPSKRIQWPSPSVILEADDLRIRARGETFKGVLSAEFIQSWAGLTDRDFDIMWLEHEREMRIDIDFDSDGTDYWIGEWLVYDGRKKSPEWVSFEGPLFVTPLEEPMEANVRLTTGKGKRQVKLIVDGMRIHAFHPGSGPAPLSGCQPPEPLDADALAAEELASFRATFTDDEWAAYGQAQEPRLTRMGLTLEEALLEDLRRQLSLDPAVQAPRSRDGIAFSPGELELDDWDEPDHQFMGTGLWTMPLTDVETLLRESGVCFEFSYTFVDQRQGNAASIAEERWCTAPPRGELVSLEYRDDVLDVTVWDHAVQAKREVPPAGWNCPTI